MLTLDGSFQWLHLEPNLLTGMSCHCLKDQLADHIKMRAKSVVLAGFLEVMLCTLSWRNRDEGIHLTACGELEL